MKTIAIRLYEVPEVPAFARGGLAKAAEHVRRAGRHGDEVLIHINPDELEQMRKAWGPPQINPKTGIPEYGFLSKAWKKVKKGLKKIAPVAGLLLNFVPGIGTVASMALQAGLGAVTGGKKGALAGMLGGAIGGGGGALGKAMGLSGKTAGTVGNALLGGAKAKVQGGNPLQGALMTGLTSGIGKGAEGADAATAGATPPIAPTATVPAAGGLDKFDIDMPDLPSVAKPSLMDTIKGIPGKAVGFAKEHPWQTGALALAAASALGSSGQKQAKAPAPPPGWNDPLPKYNFDRGQAESPDSYYTYGESGGEQQFFDRNDLAANEMPLVQDDKFKPTVPFNPRQFYVPHVNEGGALSRYVTKGTGAPGRADNIDARLSENEYVIDAETVALLGDGNPDAGAKKLDQMRQKIRAHKGKALMRGKISPNAKNALAYLR